MTFLIRENEPGNVYLIGLSPAIRRGRTVTVSYRDPTPIDGTAVLQGTNGADVHSFSNARVKNLSLLVASDPGVGPAPASARVDSDGDTVIVSFDEDVDGSSIPGSDAFAVTVGGTGVTVSGAGSGDRANDVHIEIDGAIVRDRTVTVSYTRPTSGNAIQDIDGNASVSFSDYPVVSTQARQSAPPEPLTATFEDLPGFHNGSAAFTVLLAFSEEFPVTEESIRAGLTVSGGAPGAVAQTESGKNRRWDIAVTPSAAAEAVSIALTPKESCAAEGAICTSDGRGLPETVEAEVPGREPTQVVSATVISGPGENGAWDTGETVAVEVRFSREVSLSGPPNVKPAIGITLDGTRRDAGYESGSGSDTLRFEYEVTAAEDGAARARVVANSLNLNGYVIGDAEGYEAELGFSVAPELSVADAGGTEGTDAAIAFTVTLAPAAAGQVTVHYATADGTATAPADYTSTSSTLTFEPGQTSKTVEVPIADDDEEDSGETFTLVLSDPSGAVLADAEATGTIRNTEAAPLTAEFRDLPDGHGVKPFTFELRFSEEFPLGYERLRDAAFRVTNGAVTAARRVTAGKHRVWDVTVTPSGGGAVTVALPETTDCTAAGAICTADERMLAAVSATVPETAPAGDAVPGAARGRPARACRDGRDHLQGAVQQASGDGLQLQDAARQDPEDPPGRRKPHAEGAAPQQAAQRPLGGQGDAGLEGGRDGVGRAVLGVHGGGRGVHRGRRSALESGREDDRRAAGADGCGWAGARERRERGGGLRGDARTGVQTHGEGGLRHRRRPLCQRGDGGP